jgi:hypothetical protein
MRLRKVTTASSIIAPDRRVCARDDGQVDTDSGAPITQIWAACSAAGLLWAAGAGTVISN